MRYYSPRISLNYCSTRVVLQSKTLKDVLINDIRTYNYCHCTIFHDGNCHGNLFTIESYSVHKQCNKRISFVEVIA